MPQLRPGLQVRSLDGSPQTLMLRDATAEGRAHSGLSYLVPYVSRLQTPRSGRLSLPRRPALPLLHSDDLCEEE